MKIRHVDSRITNRYTVAEESPTYWLVHHEGNIIAVPKSEWVPCPEETWRNVTGEVEIAGNGILSHRIRPNSTRALFPNEVMNGYRFVKQSLGMALPDRFTRDTWIKKTEEQNMKDRFVLTVEYKESA